MSERVVIRRSAIWTFPWSSRRWRAHSGGRQGFYFTVVGGTGMFRLYATPLLRQQMATDGSRCVRKR